MDSKFNFLTSRRFWCLIIIAILKVMETEGILPGFIVNSLVTILAGFITIRTVDRFGENIGK